MQLTNLTTHAPGTTTLIGLQQRSGSPGDGVDGGSMWPRSRATLRIAGTNTVPSLISAKCQPPEKTYIWIQSFVCIGVAGGYPASLAVRPLVMDLS
jgi:hypothetical protein